jgi:hypothetical protein
VPSLADFPSTEALTEQPRESQFLPWRNGRQFWRDADAILVALGPAGGLAAGTIRGTGRLLAAAVRLGHAGETAVRAAVNIGPASRITVNGVTRIPDGLTSTVLSEVKNVGSLSWTQQLRDFATYASQNGLRFDLYVRPGARLSGPLLDAEARGLVNILEIPF